MFSFCEDINSQNKFCEIKKNVKLSNGIVHDLYAYGFLFVAKSQASHRSMITHTSTMLLLLILWYNYLLYL